MQHFTLERNDSMFSPTAMAVVVLIPLIPTPISVIPAPVSLIADRRRARIRLGRQNRRAKTLGPSQNSIVRNQIAHIVKRHDKDRRVPAGAALDSLPDRIFFRRRMTGDEDFDAATLARTQGRRKQP